MTRYPWLTHVSHLPTSNRNALFQSRVDTLLINCFMILSPDDCIRTQVLRCRKRPLCQLCHNKSSHFKVTQFRRSSSANLIQILRDRQFSSKSRFDHRTNNVLFRQTKFKIIEINFLGRKKFWNFSQFKVHRLCCLFKWSSWASCFRQSK